jgi:Homeodomain-like domain
VALALMARLALRRAHRQAGDRTRVHRHGFRLFWTWKSRQRTGRPPVPSDVRALILELSTANPLWGAPRVHGELQKLGISVSQSTVAKYMRRHPRPPSQTWRTFLTNHARQIMAADLFAVPTITFRVLYVLVIVAHERRRIIHVAVTEYPTAPWTAQQLRNAFPENEAPAISCMIAMARLPPSRPLWRP